MVKATASLAERVSVFLGHLERDDYPRNGICSHHGPHFEHRDHYIGFCMPPAIHVRGNSWPLLITIYAPWRGFDHCARTHRRRAASIAKAINAKIITTWNGEDGSDGISAIYDRNCPAALALAILNYHGLADVFRPTPTELAAFKAFDDWLRPAFIAIGGCDD